MSGEVGILNVGAGDTKLSFDKSNPAERIRAARIVKDMLRRGYALLVEVTVDGEKKYQRATEFNEDTCEYIIADFDPVTAQTEDAQGGTHGQESETPAPATGLDQGPPLRNPRGRPRKHTHAVPAESTRSVAVARTSGG